MDRSDVYKLIDEERAYQGALPAQRTDGSDKTVGEYLVMLDYYVRRAKDDWTLSAGSEPALDEVRKIAAIAIRCMEDHGAPSRDPNGTEKT